MGLKELSLLAFWNVSVYSGDYELGNSPPYYRMIKIKK
ncbi:hypothetical protein DF16_pBMB400orf00333 (plasmid) [Bacillus thuringiensis serovar kurstaki str. YBT-1520]|nr:hypothetical protein DF16_pBMB400orf00333 [Bacillus thuringiensis serovar kurstaki str. YBT-1520]